MDCTVYQIHWANLKTKLDKTDLLIKIFNQIMPQNQIHVNTQDLLSQTLKSRNCLRLKSKFDH